MLGRRVAVLVDKIQSSGSYRIQFDASSNGHELASGIYFYRLETQDFIATKKLILLR